MYGLALVVENDGPRVVFRYGFGVSQLAPEAVAKLFATKRGLRDVILEVEIDGVSYLSCPRSGTEESIEGPDLWEEEEEPKRLAFFNLVWCAVERVEALRATVRDASGALHHEETRCGYVSREAAILVATEGDVSAHLAASSLARELREVCETGAVRFNNWIQVGAPRDGDEDESYASYEALVLGDTPERIDAELPAAASPQLRAVVSAADPRRTFRDIADATGLGIERVYRIARHLVRWKRARVAAAVRDDAVYAVSPAAEVTPEMAPTLAAFGPARRFRDAVDDLRGKVPDPAKAVLKALADGSLRQLHTYAHRIEPAPSAGLEEAAAAVLARRRRRDYFLDEDDIDELPSGKHDDDALSVTTSSSNANDTPTAYDASRLLHVFKLLSPYFDGRHSLLDMSWREDVPLAEIHNVLHTFRGLVLTVQR
ncbi:hypothetical protein CTAYLR_008493 [Chrysophaeum taylorii]|uniref:GATOR1 complex protein NPRL3 C-terminal HTH domain-containing protein n=1 Tax=Chrysophaeum taylorii TaxID=2483200 RepID=A0AAD7XJZ8_9STRA|nr:hypothetical protein CTAYLR_008493 [Chrysophaeum taylorii]